jgi:hypothetical protein
MASNRKYSNIAKGALFEVIVKKLLEQSGYINIPDDNQMVRDGKLRGRGIWHQIDAFGRFEFTIPFTFPIRLIAEAKFLKDPIGPNVIRAFVGAFKDISECYFVEDDQDIDATMLSKRYTDCGAIFSASEFNESAQRYAYAQGVSLISYETHPIFTKILTSFRYVLNTIDLPKAGQNKKDAQTKFYDALSDSIHDFPYIKTQEFHNRVEELKSKFNRVKTSYIGMAGSEDYPIYPVHILSHHEIPSDLFTNSDSAFFRVEYHRLKRGTYFELYPSDLPEKKFYFTIPEVMLQKYRKSMLSFKKQFLSTIDMPVKLNQIRRILQWKLDMEWISKFERQ